MWVFLMLSLFIFVNAGPEYITKKNCKDVDQNQCVINSVAVDPCDRGPAFCNIKREKKYVLTLDMSPKFSADNLKLSINGDVKNNGTFSTVFMSTKNGCDYLTSCPLHAEERRIFDLDLALAKGAAGKFPVQVKLWNEENESQACCFTFKVTVK